MDARLRIDEEPSLLLRSAAGDLIILVIDGEQGAARGVPAGPARNEKVGQAGPGLHGVGPRGVEHLLLGGRVGRRGGGELLGRRIEEG